MYVTQPATVSSEPSGSSIGLDDFILLRVIGRGSYAKVFVVEQKSTKRAYAMKVIKKELVNDDEVLLLCSSRAAAGLNGWSAAFDDTLGHCRVLIRV